MKRVVNAATDRDNAYRYAEKILRASKDLIDLMDEAPAELIEKNDMLWVDGLFEGGPTTSAVKLVSRREERFSCCDINIESRTKLFIISITEWWFSCSILRNIELNGLKFAPQSGVVRFDISVLRIFKQLW